MHELSIATNIVEIAEEEVIKAKAKEATEIVLEIGSMSGIVVEALEFAMEEAVKNTLLKNAKRSFLEQMAEALCTKCGHKFEVDDFFAVCPKCGSFETEVLKGKDLKVKKLIVI